MSMPPHPNPQPPRTATEAAVHDIWCACLGRPSIGVTTEFFEVGGHSLAALRIKGQLERRFTRPIPLAEVLRRLTVESFAAWLDTTSSPEPAPAPAAARGLVAPEDLAEASAEELAALLAAAGPVESKKSQR
jgi:phthiocerol/phenolphthiocerol synthesis type-I polyketide synthase E